MFLICNLDHSIHTFSEKNNDVLTCDQTRYSLDNVPDDVLDAPCNYTYEDGSFILKSQSERYTQQWNRLRSTRDKRLQDSDWTQLTDCALDAATQTAWCDYRQALRDLPDTYANPNDVVWPQKPEVHS